MQNCNVVTAAEAKTFAQAMVGKTVNLTFRLAEVGGHVTREIVIDQPRARRHFRFYAEASPGCYDNESSKVFPVGKNAPTLVSLATSEYGIKIVLEDCKTGAQRSLRVLLSKQPGCTPIVSYECWQEKPALRVAA